MLYIFGGLPGTGKTELAMHLARRVNATYLRADTIEQAMRDGGLKLTGPEGCFIAYKVAEDNLKLGFSVVADSVNPLEITRKAWREVAIRTKVGFREIEVICSGQTEHRRRIETRPSRIPGLRLPRWKDVVEREYHIWASERIVIDTAGQRPDESKSALKKLLGI